MYRTILVEDPDSDFDDFDPVLNSAFSEVLKPKIITRLSSREVLEQR
jgi:hypothetical protein